MCSNAFDAIIKAEGGKGNWSWFPTGVLPTYLPGFCHPGSGIKSEGGWWNLRPPMQKPLVAVGVAPQSLTAYVARMLLVSTSIKVTYINVSFQTSAMVQRYYVHCAGPASLLASCTAIFGILVLQSL
jgi:hypothetical protein